MSKLKQIYDEQGISTYSLTRDTGSKSRTNTLEHILNGSREITSTNLNMLTAFASGLGMRLEDILDDFDLDGTTSQILNIERQISRLFEKANAKHYIDNEDGGFVIGSNVFNPKVDDLKILKKEYDFIKPWKSHANQKTEPIYLLNRRWLKRNPKAKRNATLTNLSPRYNKYSEAYFIYSPIYDKVDGERIGGDFKMAITVKNKEGHFMFSEVYGVEFLKTEDNKHITYYKSHDNRFEVTPTKVHSWKKEEISELEFYHALFSQYNKFEMSK